MKKLINNNLITNNTIVKFILAMFAGFGVFKMVGFLTEEELDGEEQDIYDEEEYPLFV